MTRLLSHYWTGDDPIETRRAQVADWIEDLVEFGAGCVIAACAEWRRTQTRRPVPSEIRRLCIEQQARAGDRRQVGQQAAPTDMEDYARSLGFDSEADRMTAIRRDMADRDARFDRARLVREELARNGSPITAAALGATAREYTADELRAGRIALGLEKPEAAE